MTTSIDVRVGPATRRVNLSRFRDLALVPAIVALLIIGTFVDPVFLTRGNLTDVFQQQSEIALLVLGEVLILLTGRLDLSLESTMGLAPALGVLFVMPAAQSGLGVDLPGWTAIPIVLLVGVAVGLFNGLMSVRFGLSAFIVTLAMLIVLRGLQIGLTKGKTLFELPDGFTYLGTAVWLGLPASIWIFLVSYLIAILALIYFRAGRSLYAVGGNQDAARAAGIRTQRVLWTVLIIGSVLAALAGLLMTGRLGAVSPSQGDGYIFQVFAAAVIGGVSLNGGKGTVFGALCGVLVLGLITNILTLAGVSAEWQQAIYGGIILAALALARITSGKNQN